MEYRIAVATTDGVHINQHFGKAKNLNIYELDEVADTYSFVESREIKTYRQSQEKNKSCKDSCHKGGCSAKNVEFASYIATTLSDCDILLAEQIGPQAQYFLQREGIVSFGLEMDIESAVKKINEFLRKRKKRGNYYEK